MVDAEGYRSPAERRPAQVLPIVLSAETAAKFLTWSRDEKKNSAKWIHGMAERTRTSSRWASPTPQP